MIELKLIKEEDLINIIKWNENTTRDFLMQWSGNLYSYPLTINQLKYYLKKSKENFNVFIYKIILEKNKMIGTIELKISDEGRTIGRICRVLIGDEVYRGKGIGTEVIIKTLKIGFENFKLDKITLGVYDFNKSAIRCYEKAGLKKYKLIKNKSKASDEMWDCNEMYISREEFYALTNEN